MPELRSTNYDVLTFDCYGTLVDWETSIAQYTQCVLLAHDVHVVDATILEFYAAWEPLEQEVGGSYRKVLQRVMDRFGARLGFTPNPAEVAGFVDAIAMSPPFTDTVASLELLAEMFELAIISNTDTDLLETTLKLLPATFNTVVTAQELGAYKPNRDVLRRAFEIVGAKNKQILHVAQSRFHDIAPAAELGFDTVWINRNRDHAPAAQDVDVEPTWEFEDLTQFAAAFQQEASLHAIN